VGFGHAKNGHRPAHPALYEAVSREREGVRFLLTSGFTGGGNAAAHAHDEGAAVLTQALDAERAAGSGAGRVAEVLGRIARRSAGRISRIEADVADAIEGVKTQQLHVRGAVLRLHGLLAQ